MLFTTLIAALPLALAAPVEQLASRSSGTATYYNPGVGMAACDGVVHPDDTLVAAVSMSYDTSVVCNQKVTVTGPAGSVVVTVVDRCQACDATHIDLSPAAFQAAVGDLGVGKSTVDWAL
ncbi:hypothetical protein V2G26_006319 [Clonostachys chloroleuca]|jgi:expansin (peptidoglycan-binding protein)|uniref:RlpA-like protein double-psi beta-barrel domain-containing protein n=2 Tax=Clonostachys TaxID=110564 RepID=A0A9N9YEZ4_9HYPO|nr:unnamed protein product [Clonostachys rhizophaga]CAI6090150.1 unnamed protein product [Clonostachys chloroleuca]